MPLQTFSLAPCLFQEWQSRTIVRNAYTFCYPLGSAAVRAASCKLLMSIAVKLHLQP